MLKNYKHNLNLNFGHIGKLKQKIKFVDKYFYLSKRFLESMSLVFGVNYYVATQVLKMFGYSINMKIGKLSDFDKNFIADFFLSYMLVERGLKKYKESLLLMRKDIGCYAGYRLFKGLPVNGQRTHSNSKTVKKMFKFFDQKNILDRK